VEVAAEPEELVNQEVRVIVQTTEKEERQLQILLQEPLLITLVAAVEEYVILGITELILDKAKR